MQAYMWGTHLSIPPLNSTKMASTLFFGTGKTPAIFSFLAVHPQKKPGIINFIIIITMLFEAEIMPKPAAQNYGFLCKQAFQHLLQRDEHIKRTWRELCRKRTNLPGMNKRLIRYLSPHPGWCLREAAEGCQATGLPGSEALMNSHGVALLSRSHTHRSESHHSPSRRGRASGRRCSCWNKMAAVRARCWSVPEEGN